MMEGDTIAALSTPLGEGGIGIVRISGPQAIPLAEAIFHPTDRIPLSQVPTHTLHHGFVVSKGRRIDEVLVSVMRAPRTYTREDVVEINCHGGFLATQAVLSVMLKQGARLAERGEFTKRAFLNGRISLDQAQAVVDIVKAKTRLGLEAAVEQLGGRFSNAISRIREQIGGLLAQIEVEIDFPDVEAETGAIVPPLTELVNRVELLLTQAEQGRIVREGFTIAIIGRPNVGKSTLLNALLAEERAIVTPIPGTTRDTVEEEAAIGGIPVRLIDTAGLRTPTDTLEEAGIERTNAAITRADLLLLILDRSAPLDEQDHRLLGRTWEKPTLLVLNKSDLPAAIEPTSSGPWKSVHEISAKLGSGVDRLSQALLELLLGGKVQSWGAIFLLNTWEQDLLGRAGGHLDRAIATARSGSPPDIIAEELRSAYIVTGELQGIDVSEDVLDQIFARFCVGK